LVLCTLSCATGSPPAPAAGVPAALEVPGGGKRLATLQASGVQIYACAAGKDGGPPGWSFKSPRAALTDGPSTAAGKHFAGPTWEFLNGSQVIGEVLQKVAAPPGNIPWLLLRVKSSTGTSPFGAVAFIQRLDTSGGVAPAAGCDAAHLGAEVEVPYTAAYAFWGAAP
jgi:hypothetical protein